MEDREGPRRMVSVWPALNPVNFFIWSHLENEAYSKKHRSVDSLEENKLKVSEEMSVKYVRATLDAFHIVWRLVFVSEEVVFGSDHAIVFENMLAKVC